MSDAARGGGAESGGPPEDVARLIALHEAAVALTAPVAPEPDAVEALLGTIVRAARDAMGAAHARLVLSDDLSWRSLLPGTHDAEAAPVALAEGYEKRVTASLHVMEDGEAQLRWQRLRKAGPIARAIETGRAIFIPDVTTDVEYGPHPVRERLGFRSVAVAPLKVMGHVLGTLSVTYRAAGAADAADRRALELFAAHAAAAVERVRSLHDERRRVHHAERIAAVLAAVGAATKLEAGLEALVRGAIDLLGGVCGTARVRDPDTGERLISVTVEQGGSLVVRRPAGAPRPGSFAADIEAGGPAVLVEDFRALDPQTYPYYEEMRRAGLHAGLVVPIDVGERRIGSLHFDHPTPAYFTQLDLSLAETLASYAGLAVARLRLQEALDQRARLDGAMLVARTVAHEINNALSPVVGYAELLGLRPAVAADPQAADFVRQIGEAAADATAKVVRLQRIVRLQEEPSPLGPAGPILDMERSTGT